MITRPATVADARGIASAHARAWQAGYTDAFPTEFLDAIDVDDWTSRRRGRISGLIPPAAIYVAVDDQRILGFTHVGPARFDDDERRESGIGEVWAIYVDPDHWSSGVGSALMRTALAHLTGTGFAKIRLWVLSGNTRARRFYERCGFTADGAAKTFTVDRGGRHETQAIEVRYTLRRAEP